MNTKVINLYHRDSGMTEASEISLQVEEKETHARITIAGPSSSSSSSNATTEDLVRVHWADGVYWIQYIDGTRVQFSDINSYPYFPENNCSDGTADSYYPGFLSQNTDRLKGCWGDALLELYSQGSAARYNAFMRLPLAVLFGVTYLRGASGEIIIDNYPPDQFGRLTQILRWIPINKIQPPGYTWCVVAGDPIYMRASGLA